MVRCKINGVTYRLDALLTTHAKQEGLKKYPFLPARRGVIFIYNKDCYSSYDFSEIDYECKIFFLDSNFKLIHCESTTALQEKTVSCPDSFRYVIEISI